MLLWKRRAVRGVKNLGEIPREKTDGQARRAESRIFFCSGKGAGENYMKLPCKYSVVAAVVKLIAAR
jgi:hypothetical protein